MQYKYSHELTWGERDDLCTPILIDGVEVAQLYIDNDQWQLELFDPEVTRPADESDGDAMVEFYDNRISLKYECDEDNDLVQLMAFVRFFRSNPTENWQIDVDFVKEKTGFEPRPYY